MNEQKLKKVGPRERMQIALATSTNRRAMEHFEREQRRKKGPAACTWCGAEPCGALWTRPGEEEPGGDRCCQNCSHDPVEGWQHTHTARIGDQRFAVCALTMREGEVVYLRRDGVVQLLELRATKVGAALGEEEETDVPVVAFLGAEPDGAVLHRAGEGGPDATSLWSNRRELDPLWLLSRRAAAVARDDERKARRHAERKAREAAHDARVAELEAEEARAREASIARRALAHETRIVMDEVEVGGDDTAEEAPEMPAPSTAEAAEPEREVFHIQGVGESEGKTLCGREARSVRCFVEVEPAQAAEKNECCKHCGRCARPELFAPEEPEPRRLTLAELKQPAAPRATGGRLRRSWRQRQARERQKRAWARQEAKNRLEVKRLERLARAEAQNLVKGEK